MDAPRQSPAIAGRVTYLYSYDVAYEMLRQPVRELMGVQAEQFQLPPSRRTPREAVFYCPQMVRLPAHTRTGPHGPVEIRATVKLFPVGAISITVDVPFRVGRIGELAAYHDLKLDGRPLEQEVRQLAQVVTAQLRPQLVRPVEPVREEEAYTVFCIDPRSLAPPDAADFRAEAWFLENRRDIAALLVQDEPDLLSGQEVDDTVSHSLTYYRDDLVVADWDAALVVDEEESLEELLYIVELANVQLAELEAYDRILDEGLDRSYRDLARRPAARISAVLRGLRELGLDLSRLSDELSNTGKFFGDWHLARIYQRLFVLFHLGDWQRAIDEKLRTLGNLYQMIRQDENNRWMMILEVSIVLLFIIDLVILLVGLKK